jgi:DNA repair exonuclease SbcCD ATPase subunit
MLPNKDLLTPGPWSVNGNTVKDVNGKTIAVCFSRNATAHAYWVAALPDFAELVGKDGRIADHEQEIEGLRAQIATLEQENNRLSESDSDASYETSRLMEENADLREKITELEKKVKSLEVLGR